MKTKSCSKLRKKLCVKSSSCKWEKRCKISRKRKPSRKSKRKSSRKSKRKGVACSKFRKNVCEQHESCTWHKRRKLPSGKIVNSKCKKNPKISASIFFNFFSKICKQANNYL